MQENTTNGNQVSNEDVSQPWGMINELKMKEKTTSTKFNDHLWSEQLKFWIAISLLPAAICAIIAIFYFSFIYLALLFPFIAVISWYIRKIFIRHDLDKEDWLK